MKGRSGPLVQSARAALEPLLPDLATGVRAALATVVPLSLSVERSSPVLSWIALGGWLATLSDPSGSRLSRARVLAGFVCVGTVYVALSESVAPYRALAVLFLALATFAVTMLRAWGEWAQTFGTTLAVVAAIGTTRVSPSPLEDALGFAAGGAIAVFLSSIVWPVWVHLPVRKAVAAVFVELSAYAAAVQRCGREQPGEGTLRWVQVAQRHPRRIREAIERAREMSLSVHARRAGQSRVGSNLRILLGLAESQFLTLAGLATEMEVSGGPLVEGALGRASVLFADIAERVLPGAPNGRPKVAEVSSSHALAARLLADAELSLQLASALAEAPKTKLAAPATFESQGDRRRVELRLLADAMTSESPVFRHAVRAAAAGGAAAFIGGLVSPLHASWVTLSAIVLLQPYTGATLRRAFERVIGTVVGSTLAVLITAGVRARIMLAALMFPLSVAALATRPRSYRLFTLFLTPVFLLIAMRYPGDVWTAAERVGDTLLGGGIATACVAFIYPRAQVIRGLSRALGAMDEAVRGYAAMAYGFKHGESVHDPALDRSRRAAAFAISEVEVALEYLLAGSKARDDSEVNALMRVTYARRVVLASTTLVAWEDTASAEDHPMLQTVRARLQRLLELYARAAASEPEPTAQALASAGGPGRLS